MLAIDIQNLYKSYKNDKVALEGINLEIPQGKIFGLLGPNGAGKSTIINILSGMVSKTSGTVKIMGHNIDIDHKTAKTKIGVVPQEIVIDNFFSISQTLEFTAGYYGIRKKDIKVDELLTALGLYDKRNALPRHLSGGMKRRFLIAKAMIHSPAVLVLDEPTAGVDIQLRNQLWDYVRILNNKGTTIILTTHYLHEAENLCEQIAFINHGKIIKQDYTSNLLKDFGTKTIKIEFTFPVDSKIIKSMPYGFTILSDNLISLNFNPKDFNYNNLLKELSLLNLPIQDIRIDQVDLETVFNKMIS